MITVKMLLPLLKNAKEIFLDWNGLTRKIDPDDALDLDAFGPYVVDRILNVSTSVYELRIALLPVKAE